MGHALDVLVYLFFGRNINKNTSWYSGKTQIFQCEVTDPVEGGVFTWKIGEKEFTNTNGWGLFNQLGSVTYECPIQINVARRSMSKVLKHDIFKYEGSIKGFLHRDHWHNAFK